MADPRLIAQERLVLAQKYGYELPEEKSDLMEATKDPRQVFYGLHPGWIVNLKEKTIFKPVENKEIEEHYTS